jgi:predicted enzyme related to lactoylglutathione lyase
MPTSPSPWLHAFLDVPDELADTTARFCAAVTGATIGSPWPGHPEFRSLEPTTGSRYLHVQRHGGPPRVHLDLITPDVDAETARLVGLGAVAGVRERWWQVLASPGGLPFCLVTETPGRSCPAPVRWPGGQRSRVDQLVLDVPADRYDAECRFWPETTGWTPQTCDRPEALRLLPPSTSPVQLLLQHSPDPADAVRAQLDLGTDDVAAEVRRVTALGATGAADRAGHGGTRVPLTDPAGLIFSVTDPHGW